MTNEEAIAIIQNEYKCVDRECDIERSCGKCNLMTPNKEPILEAYKLAIKALEQQPCEMTTEEYRQRMIQAFHNADTDELIAVCVLPTEKEFEHLEWLLKNHYKKAPCVDAISRQAVLYGLVSIAKAKAKSDAQKALMGRVMFFVEKLPPVTPQQKYGKWIIIDDCEQFIAKCSECGRLYDSRMISKYPYCHCGAKMQESEKV